MNCADKLLEPQFFFNYTLSLATKQKTNLQQEEHN